MSWGSVRPKRAAEDVAFAVARFYQRGGSLQNYYMVVFFFFKISFPSLALLLLLLFIVISLVVQYINLLMYLINMMHDSITGELTLEELPVDLISPHHMTTMLLLMNTVVLYNKIFLKIYLYISHLSHIYHLFIGNLNQPKYGHSTQLHNLLMSMEKTLTEGNVTEIDFGNGAEVLFHYKESYIFFCYNLEFYNIYI